jgi:2,5-diketo-D-gluconate reductase A
MAIRAVVFDAGNVLELSADDYPYEQWAATAGVTPGQFTERTSDIWAAGGIGAITLAEVHRQLGASLEMSTDGVSDLMEQMWRVYLGVPNTELIEWARTLRPAYRTGILSNSFVGAREREQAAYGYRDLVDDLVYSHEVGMLKPDPRIYALSCGRLGVSPGEAVLLDDREPFVAGAREAGMSAVAFHGDNASAIAEISGLLGWLYGLGWASARRRGLGTRQGEDTMTAERMRQLSDGTAIPMLGLGVWQVPNGATTVSAVRWALELGYRHIDTAQLYRNEEGVGQALQESGVPRDEVYVTTKFNPSAKDPVTELEHSLKRLGLDQVDLYLVHWPRGGATRFWKGMEQARERGLARSIGVSNYSAADLEQVLRSGSVSPVVNQVQFSAVEYRRGLLEAGEEQGIVTEAYSPLGTGRHLGDRRVAQIAARAGRTPAQVLLRWCVQHGVPVIPKSVRRERIAENAQIFDFSLTEADMAALDALDATGGTSQARRDRWW